MAHCSIGTSGWNYPHWGNGTFYPKGLSSTHWLTHYARFFSTVEVNNTFYRLPKRETFDRWREETPANFTFALKASRFITHVKKLTDPDKSLTLFHSAAAALEEKLGPILFQLPPNWKVNTERLAQFLNSLRQRRSWKDITVVLEFREQTWLCEEVYRILADHQVALCLADFPQVPIRGPITAPVVYLRRHGPTGPYSSKYSPAFLRKEGKQIQQWLKEGKEVYVYFNNDVSGHAVQNALTLQSLVGATKSKT